MTQSSFEYVFRIRLRDTDAAGVLFFSRLLEHAHDAFEALMHQLGHPLSELLSNGGTHLPLVHAEADYLAPMRLGDQVLVHIQVLKLGPRSFTLAYSFESPDGVNSARAKTVHVAMHPQNGKTGTLPAFLRDAIQSSGLTQK